MTSVVGILNKRGVALAADSAVTRTRIIDEDGRQKISNNGNKMIRLSESSPICLMITGRNDFLGTPWDIIARRYRKCRGMVEHHSIESAVEDFFRFISETKQFWDITSCNENIKILIRHIYNNRLLGIREQLEIGKKRITEDLIEELDDDLVELTERSKYLCSAFSGYSVEDFSKRVRGSVDIVFSELSKGKGGVKWPMELLVSSREALIEVLYSMFKRQYDVHQFDDERTAPRYYTELIFCGYDIDSKYPSLVPVMVKEAGGIDGHISYYYREEEIVRISDSRPAAICPFAQTDVMETVLDDSSEIWRSNVLKQFSSVLNDSFNGRITVDSVILQDLKDMEEEKNELMWSTRRSMYDRSVMNWQKWETFLPDYDLKSMADLAESLIELTEFNRVLTFKQEGVGGTIDLATISRSDGFSWLNRKSWYHKKDTDGMHGKFGI